MFLSLFVPGRHRAKILSLFYLAQPLTIVIGAPLASALISADGLFGLEGWRLMLMGVAIPAIVVGVISWFYLPDRPADAKWLTPDEQEWLTKEVEAEAAAKVAHTGHANIGAAFKSGRVWTLALIYFGFIYGLYALTFFLPTKSPR